MGVIVSGDTTESESVVLDFSTAKKQIKNLIDHQEYGLDHKLWIPKELEDSYLGDDGTFYFVSKETKFALPENAIRRIDLSIPIYQTIEKFLKYHMPEFDFSVVLDESVPFVFGNVMSNPGFFRYTHGLKDSTSWGCQNISHGHMSYIYTEGPNAEACEALNIEIAQHLEESVFVMRSNIIKEDGDFVLVGYRTERGDFAVDYNRTLYKLCILETETTIEFLVDYVARLYATKLKEAGVTKLFVSEGLLKGACVSMENY